MQILSPKSHAHFHGGCIRLAWCHGGGGGRESSVNPGVELVNAAVQRLYANEFPMTCPENKTPHSKTKDMT